MNTVEPYRPRRLLDRRTGKRLKRWIAASDAHAARWTGPSFPATGRRRRPVRLRLWLPVSLLWLLMAPLAILAAPIVAATAARRRGPVNPLALVWRIGALLFALSGTLVEVEAPGASIKLRLI